MLELRPNCEVCDKDLPPASSEARICSYECTYCKDCADHVLHNVCPNCGGGLVPRPIRPSMARRSGVSLAHQPASTHRVHSKYSAREIRDFTDKIKDVRPEDR
ncbi:MAG: DUF1272 domain-containing protein [Proteobacteria bacterium]|nr:DUF1272 domain-containing protein [Pseudomonadota bacterium]